MSKHRAPKRRATAPNPFLRPIALKGRRRVVPTAVGLTAVTIAGIATLGSMGAVDPSHASASVSSAANTGTDAQAALSWRDQSVRLGAISRDFERRAVTDATERKLQADAKNQVVERNAAISRLRVSAEKMSTEIARNQWVLPVKSYRLTARFGQSSGLWSSVHTGLDFATPVGTPVYAVANGTIKEANYAGAYGNRVVMELEDGTEIWYCHLNSFVASPGQKVQAGDQIAESGNTGNSTGPHVHLEVRPGGGDPIDPDAALKARDVTP